MRTRRSQSPRAPSLSFDAIAIWRRDRLLTAGFPPGLASDIARDRDVDVRVDLQAMLGLIERGCTPRLAAQILAPLEPTTE